MNKEEFLLDMLDYYTVDPENRRCQIEGECKYSPETLHLSTSEGCAIGRHVTKEAALYLDNEYVSVNNIFARSSYLKLLPEWLSDLGVDFLKHCQNLHDHNNHWNNKGLTHVGKEAVEMIIKEFNLDKSKFEKYL